MAAWSFSALSAYSYDRCWILSLWALVCCIFPGAILHRIKLEYERSTFCLMFRFSGALLDGRLSCLGRCSVGVRWWRGRIRGVSVVTSMVVCDSLMYLYIRKIVLLKIDVSSSDASIIWICLAGVYWHSRWSVGFRSRSFHSVRWLVRPQWSRVWLYVIHWCIILWHLKLYVQCD